MSWYKFIENHARLHAFFGDADLPTNVDLHEVIFHRDGPELRLRFDIAAVPSPLPAKWPSNASITQFTLSLYGITSVSLQGFATTIRGPLTVTQDMSGTVLSFSGDGCALTARGQGGLFIHSVEGYGVA